MIVEYHRPKKLKDALKLLARKSPPTRPLGGGTVLSAPSPEKWAVVDVQNLGLDSIKSKGKSLCLGAALSLQSLLESEHIPADLAAAIRHENSYNLRQVATIAGSLVSADGRSPFAVAMLALNAQLTLLPSKEKKGYGHLLPLRDEALSGCLITEFFIPAEIKLAYEYVARSPADLPIIALALARWPSGRARLTVGGFGPVPLLALDGRDASGLAEALENALTDSDDQWASAEYRAAAASALLPRALHSLEQAAA